MITVAQVQIQPEAGNRSLSFKYILASLGITQLVVQAKGAGS